MFKAFEILTAMKDLLESQLPPAMKIVVGFDEDHSFSKDDFEGGVSHVVLSVHSDDPNASEEGFTSGHTRTLNLRFEIRTLGFPAQRTVEPIAKAIADIVYGEQRKLSYGTSAVQHLVQNFELPTLGYAIAQSDKAYAGAALDIPTKYFSNYPI